MKKLSLLLCLGLMTNAICPSDDNKSLKKGVAALKMQKGHIEQAYQSLSSLVDMGKLLIMSNLTQVLIQIKAGGATEIEQKRALLETIQTRNEELASRYKK